jgi:hypothetical protein
MPQVLKKLLILFLIHLLDHLAPQAAQTAGTVTVQQYWQPKQFPDWLRFLYTYVQQDAVISMC